MTVCLQVNVQVKQCPSATASVFSPSVLCTYTHIFHISSVLLLKGSWAVKHSSFHQVPVKLSMLVAVMVAGASSSKNIRD